MCFCNPNYDTNNTLSYNVYVIVQTVFPVVSITKMIQTVISWMPTRAPHYRQLLWPFGVDDSSRSPSFFVRTSFIIPNSLPDPARYLSFFFLCSIPSNLVSAFPVVSLLDVCLKVCRLCVCVFCWEPDADDFVLCVMFSVRMKVVDVWGQLIHMGKRICEIDNDGTAAIFAKRCL